MLENSNHLQFVLNLLEALQPTASPEASSPKAFLSSQGTSTVWAHGGEFLLEDDI